MSRRTTCTVCGRKDPLKQVITARKALPVCECHVGDVIGDRVDVEGVIPNY